MSVDPTKIDIRFDPELQRMSGHTVGFGNVYFDVPFISPIAKNLWQGGCEEGMILPSYIKHLVSLYPWERYSVKHELSSKLEVRMLDNTNQAFEQVEAIARWINTCREDAPTLVHCQAGLNRSSLVAARALILEGMTAKEAIALLREKRSPAVLCNPSFEKYLLDLDPDCEWCEKIP
jgi:protein-tyrosine phosphatase